MTHKILKLLLICFLSMSVLSLRNRLKAMQPQPDMNNLPPNEGNITGPAQLNYTLPPSEAVNITKQPAEGGNITEPQVEAANITKQPSEEGNITEPQVEAANITKQPSEGGNITEPQVEAANITKQPSEEGNITQSQVEENRTQIASILRQGGSANLSQDIIKIKAIYENNNLLLGEASNLNPQSGEASKQNDQKTQELIAKLKDLQLTDENIRNIGTFFKIRNLPSSIMGDKELNLNPNQSFGNNQTNGNNQLIAATELEIKVNDSALAEKVIDLLNSQNFIIESLNYKHEPSFIKKLSSQANENLKICLWFFGHYICIGG